MYIQFRKYRNPVKNSQVHVTTISQRRYEFWGKDEWICDVRRKSDIEYFLSGRGAGAYDVAYGKYGIHFDPTGTQVHENGKAVGAVQEAISVSQIPDTGVSFTQTSETSTTGPQELTPTVSISPVRVLSKAILRMREARDRKRVERGLPPIDWKS